MISNTKMYFPKGMFTPNNNNRVNAFGKILNWPNQMLGANTKEFLLSLNPKNLFRSLETVAYLVSLSKVNKLYKMKLYYNHLRS